MATVRQHAKLHFREELVKHKHVNMNSLVGSTGYGGVLLCDVKRRGTWRNFIILCTATFLSFIAVFPSRNLQSSIHQSLHMGTVSLFALYGFYVVGCLSSNFLVRKFRAKCLLIVALIFHVMYSVSNVIPSMYTLIPASCLLGISQPLFWNIQELTLLGYSLNYSAVSTMDIDRSLRLFQTIIVITIHSAQILGNLLSSGLLSVSNVKCADIWSTRMLSNYSHELEKGEHFRSEKWTYTLPLIPVLSRKLSEPPGPINYYQFLTVLYLCLGVVAVGSVLIFFESPDIFVKKKVSSWKERLGEIGAILTKPKCVLAGFGALFTGFSTGLIVADILKNFGTDIFGCFIVGYMMVCFGTGNLASILCFDKFRKHGLSASSLTTGFLLNSAVLIMAFVWVPESNQAPILLIYLAVWGVADGILQCQLQAAIPRFLPQQKETALVGLRVLNGVGMEISFILSITVGSLMTSLFTALGLHLIGFLGLVLLVGDSRSREAPLPETDAIETTLPITQNMVETTQSTESLT